eukprot:TRINITY_DN17335_c0_g1_i1.p1 TRINITY_DN17335_c0_g1~~TRINITY_DN17335_c0_g1_i1.p1  ORF type:complete len:155 (-),score=25.93 TRINITY_DN17335_c0_g1_i1:301-765(-)
MEDAVVELSQEKPPMIDSPDLQSFTITTAGRTCVVCAQTQDEAQQWIAAIMHHGSRDSTTPRTSFNGFSSASAGSSKICSPPTWVPDADVNACGSCCREFALWRRKHHCRGCGQVFCNSCTTHFCPLKHMGMNDPVRVCDQCFIKTTHGQSNTY